MVRLRKHTFRPFRLSQAVVRKHIESLSNMNQADARCIPEKVPFLVSQEISTGRDDRIRTCDPHTPSVMRYQAALRPDLRSGIAVRGRGYMVVGRAWQALCHAYFAALDLGPSLSHLPSSAQHLSRWNIVAVY